MRGIFSLVLIVAGLSGCGNDVSFGDSIEGPDDPTETKAASVKLIADSPQLPSGAFKVDDGITLTAIVKDAKGQLLANVPVEFSAPDAAVQVDGGGLTDSSGTVTGTLTTGGDPTNRIVQISASSGNVSSESVSIAVVGSSLQINGPTIVGSGAPPATYTVTLLDSAGEGMPNETVTVSNATNPGPNNPISETDLRTDFNGQATFTYTGTHGGTDTLTVSASGATTTLDLVVTPDVLAFTSPAPGNQIPFGTDRTLTVRLTTNGAPTAGQTITFKTTRGYFDNTPGKTSTTVGPTSADGTATVHLKSNGSDGAGEATIEAQVGTSGPSTSLTVIFIATTPTSIDLQASPTTVATSGSTTVTATLRDANNNLVANQQVDFRLTDSTGGSLSAATGITNLQGSVSVTYHASQASSAANGVVVNARVHNFPAVDTCTTGGSCAPPSTCPVGQTCAPALITVGGQALFITLGTGNEIFEPNETTYKMPWNVKVVDAAGQPAPPNTVFRLSVTTRAYQKGAMACSDAWFPEYTVPPPSVRFSFGAGCPNEDVNNNGILDPNDDDNNNGVLDPGNVANVPDTLELEPDGTTQFEITYPQDVAFWTEVTLRATATVAGTESVKETTFVLPGLADDYDDCDEAPPGQISPYGTGSSCANEIDAACSDGEDNDGDGAVDAEDAACYVASIDPESGDTVFTFNPLLDTEDKADLTVSITGPSTAAPGETLAYTVKVTNNGPQDASVVSLSYTIPDSTTFVSNPAPSGWSCNNPVPGVDGRITCTTSALAAGASATFTISVKVDDDAVAGTIENVATVSSKTSDPFETNNSREKDTTIVVGP